MRGQTFNSDQHTTVGRRLADGGVLTSSGDNSGTDREDSPLQSKRSSMFEIIIYFYLFNFLSWFIPPKCNIVYVSLLQTSSTLCTRF